MIKFTFRSCLHTVHSASISFTRFTSIPPLIQLRGDSLPSSSSSLCCTSTALIQFLNSRRGCGPSGHNEAKNRTKKMQPTRVGLQGVHPIGVDDTKIASPNGNGSGWCDWMVHHSRESQLSVSHPLKMPCSDRATQLTHRFTHPVSRLTIQIGVQCVRTLNLRSITRPHHT